MTLDEMWERLEAHQPFADKRGYGTAWRQMCEERTRQTADAVGDLLWREFREHMPNPGLYAAWAAWSAAYVLRNLEQVSVQLNKSEEA
jgi:hypothetical protein